MISVRPLDLSSTEMLTGHIRRCVHWEVEPDCGVVADPEFEKETWFSRVLLEWGVCGQLAVSDGRTVGAALYAPPRMVPGAARYPTAPAGADAILLTALTEVPDRPSEAIRAHLVDAVVADLRGRGIKALEAFGHTGPGSGHPPRARGSLRGDQAAGEQVVQRIERGGDRSDPRADDGPAHSRAGCGEIACMTSTAFLLEHGFSVVAHDPVHPRLRLDIEADHLWKADVERALDQLMASSGIPSKVLGQLAGVTARDRRMT